LLVVKVQYFNGSLRREKIMQNIFGKVNELSMTNKSFVLCTIVEIKGSSPGKTGFRMIVFPDKKTIGTVGGGAIEGKVIQDALKIFESNENALHEYVLNEKKELVEEDVEIVPMMCNGSVKIYYEVFGNSPNVYLFGGGHVGQELAKILPGLGYFVYLIDNREEFANRDKNPHANKIELANYIDYSNNFEPKPDSFALIITHGHTFDYDILKTLIKRKLKMKYIGVIASKSKAQKMKNKLLEELGEGITLENVHSPVGLPIGGDTAAEIAVSVAAEMQKIRYNK
jgi:xanthine dehydrogenase accessory factor